MACPHALSRLAHRPNTTGLLVSSARQCPRTEDRASQLSPQHRRTTAGQASARAFHEDGGPSLRLRLLPAWTLTASWSSHTSLGLCTSQSPPPTQAANSPSGGSLAARSPLPTVNRPASPEGSCWGSAGCLPGSIRRGSTPTPCTPHFPHPCAGTTGLPARKDQI